jgi:spermidine synthase
MYLQLMKQSNTLWNALIFSTGFCSLIYELAFAQLLAGLLGNTFFRFATTLGIYIVGLGLGSIAFRSKGVVPDQRTFLRAEMLLACCGLASAFLFIAFLKIFSSDPSSLTLLIATHSVVFAIGFLSGFELPALNAILASRSGDHESRTLAYDYYGMFFGSLLFPLLMVPLLGVLSTLWFVTFLNLVATLVTLRVTEDRRVSDWVVLSLAFAINFALLANVGRIESWMSQIYATPV